MVDPYPSRRSVKASIIERKDPIVYTNIDNPEGPLSSEQLKSFEKNGFLFLKQFFSPEEVNLMNQELSRVWHESNESSGQEIIREPESNEVRSVFAVHKNDSFFKQLSHDPRLENMLSQLLGSKVYIHQSRINLKAGFKGKEFYWHSDFETWHVEDGMSRMRAISCSVTLTENTPYNGPLMLIPGSHKHFVSCVGKTPKDHYEQSLRRQEYGVPDSDSLTQLYKQGGIVSPTGPAGSVILFDCNVMHGSNSNISPLARSNIFFVYNSVENKLVEPFSGQKPRPGYIAARDLQTV